MERLKGTLQLLGSVHSQIQETAGITILDVSLVFVPDGNSLLLVRTSDGTGGMAFNQDATKPLDEACAEIAQAMRDECEANMSRQRSILAGATIAPIMD